MMERAILQHESSRDGVGTPYERPHEVRERAKRLLSWRHGAQEACRNCRAGDATVLRSGVAFCVSCHVQAEERYASVVSSRGVFPAAEPRDEAAAEQAITGIFVVFNSESLDLGGFVEIVKPEAVDRSLSTGQDVRALWSHDTGLPIGRTGPKTLTLRKEKAGLYGEIQPPAWASSYLETVSRGDVNGASFGFQVIEDVWRIDREREFVLREIVDMTIYEVSPVSFPAYPATRIKVEDMKARKKRAVDARLRAAV